MTEELRSICILKGDEPFWADVKKFLSRANAPFFTLDPDTDLTVLDTMLPSLLLMNLDAYFTLPSLPGGFMRLVISEEEVSTQFIRPGSGRKVVMIGWPQDESIFLELTSRLLSVPPRRFFKALIQILPKGDNVAYVGESENFSLTGLGFSTNHALHQGDKVKISFAVPSNRVRAELEAEVVRCLPGCNDQSASYGARYLSLDPNVKTVMNNFIRNI